MIPVTHITEHKALCQLVARAREAEYVALDTEFIRTDTFYPRAALIQLSCHGECFLIDPLSIEDLRPLAELLTDADVTKVLHACSEDLQVFQLCTGVIPEPLFDTQLAAGFLGEGLSIGYQKLVKAWAGIDLPKEETRSDWLNRPLATAQQQYAAQDVAFLPSIYQDQKSTLKERGTLRWVQEDCQRLVDDAKQIDEPELYFKKVKVAWRLSPESLCVLKHVCAWRERMARERNIPRSHLIPERSLWPISRYKPKDVKSLSRVDGMNRHIIRRDGEQIIAIVKSAMETEKNSWPAQLPKPLPPSVGVWVKKLKAIVSNISKEYGIAPEILLRKKFMEELIRSGYPHGEFVWPKGLNGWRNEVIAQDLLEELGHLSKNEIKS